MPDERHVRHRSVWQQKRALRIVYEDYYRHIIRSCRTGRTLEVGGGSGNFKALFPEVVSTDLASEAWLDAAADAQALPFRDQVFANVVAVDVLHHIERPVRFLREAGRVLAPGGRLVLLEPGVSRLSRILFSRFHPEPIDLSVDPLADGPLSADRDPYVANQAIATLLLRPEHRQRLLDETPSFALVETRWLSVLAYPLSGGFRRWSLIPAKLAPSLLRLEEHLLPKIGPLLAFRLLLVFERR